MPECKGCSIAFTTNAFFVAPPKQKWKGIPVPSKQEKIQLKELGTKGFCPTCTALRYIEFLGKIKKLEETE